MGSGQPDDSCGSGLQCDVAIQVMSAPQMRVFMPADMMPSTVAVAYYSRFQPQRFGLAAISWALGRD